MEGDGGMRRTARAGQDKGQRTCYALLKASKCIPADRAYIQEHAKVF